MTASTTRAPAAKRAPRKRPAKTATAPPPAPPVEQQPEQPAEAEVLTGELLPAGAKPIPRSNLAPLPGQVFWTPEQLAALRQLGVEDAPEGDLRVFLAVCQRTGLDPFLRHIYLIGRYSRTKGRVEWTIQTGIDGFRLVAENSDAYAGQEDAEWCGPDGVWRNVWLDKEPPAAARVRVLRRGFMQPVTGLATWSEYHVSGNGGHMWAKMPSHMLAKCAEALALRKAFPQRLAGVYTTDELEATMAREMGQQPALPAAEQDDTAKAEAVQGMWGSIIAAVDTKELQACWQQLGAQGIPNELVDVPVGWQRDGVTRLPLHQLVLLAKEHLADDPHAPEAGPPPDEPNDQAVQAQRDAEAPGRQPQPLAQAIAEAAKSQEVLAAARKRAAAEKRAANKGARA